MYVIVAYDVNKKRVKKVLKICRKYLTRVQNSLFEGHITDSNLSALKKELSSVIAFNKDTICIYHMNSTKHIFKEEIGVTPKKDVIV